MLSKEQLDMLKVDSVALDLVPESVARLYCVLPVSALDGELHLVVPTTARELITSEGDTLDRLRFILGCDFTYEMADAGDLEPVVDLHYLAVHSDIRNCKAELAIQCPKYWSQLAPTDTPTIRFCSKCDQNVHFCLTTDELTQRTADNLCVAFCDSETQTVTLGLLEIPDE